LQLGYFRILAELKYQILFSPLLIGGILRGILNDGFVLIGLFQFLPVIAYLLLGFRIFRLQIF